jgi:hypothetical protein
MKVCRIKATLREYIAAKAPGHIVSVQGEIEDGAREVVGRFDNNGELIVYGQRALDELAPTIKRYEAYVGYEVDVYLEEPL